MADELLQTKLYVPRLRPSLIPRSRLVEKLNAGLHGVLTIVSAPAGFGKTTLVVKWLSQLSSHNSQIGRVWACAGRSSRHHQRGNSPEPGLLAGKRASHFHLVIMSRADPPLPLARLRVSGELVEIGGDDLRFTPSETAEFLNRVMKLELAPDDIAALGERTECWIASLQLAALSLPDK